MIPLRMFAGRCHGVAVKFGVPLTTEGYSVLHQMMRFAAPLARAAEPERSPSRKKPLTLSPWKKIGRTSSSL